MPLIVSASKLLPAYVKLEAEGVPIIHRDHALKQDIRPLNIGLLNLMPSAVYQQTELQFFRLLGNTPLQINPILVRLDTYEPSREEGRDHLQEFYQPFHVVKERGLDALLITGANIEHLHKTEIKYWDELCDVFEWADANVTSTLYCCWTAHVALEYFYSDLQKVLKPRKIFGCFKHQVVRRNNNQNELTKNMDDEFLVPHSHWGHIERSSIDDCLGDVEILIESRGTEAQWHVAASSDLRRVFVQGHPEYDREDLKGEYLRDKHHGQSMPCNYFPNDDETQPPLKSWSANGQVMYSNWINHVYQLTPYETSIRNNNNTNSTMVASDITESTAEESSSSFSVYQRDDSDHVMFFETLC